MSFKCGIVGLPNVGKSTIFNAVTNSARAQAANYPFCTIEPNVGRIAVPDSRLNKLSVIAASKKVVPNFVDIVDIAGLVKGASKGEGLGNQFLAHIKEVDAIIHVVRCFENDDIIHVEGKVDPIRDLEVIETELMLSDLSTLEKRSASLQKDVKAGKAAAIAEHEVVQKLSATLAKDQLLNSVTLTEEEELSVKSLGLLTRKKVMLVANVNEDDLKQGNPYLAKVKEYAVKHNLPLVSICGQLEADMLDFPEEEKNTFLKDMGYEHTGLEQMVQTGYSLLKLITFFTVGEKEARAWSVHAGATAPQAAGVIHTDFEKGFIKAETIAYDDFIACGGESGARDQGKLRIEGKEYKVKDGDIFHFKFNV